MRDKFAKLRICLEKGIDYMTLLKVPRYDHRSQQWIVLTESGIAHRFDEENEAEQYYNANMPEELR